MKKKIYTSGNLKTVLVFLFLLISFADSYSQYQISHYNLSCGTSGQEYGRSIINRVDNGYAIAGYSYQSPACIGNYDWMFLKLLPDGNLSCVNLIGNSQDDKCYSVVQTGVDSGFVLAGYTSDNSSPFRKKATVVKLTKNCNLQAARCIFDTLNSNYYQDVRDPSNTIANTGYIERQITVGIKRNKILASQYSPAGGLNWAYVYNSGGLSTEEAYSICYQPVGGTYCMAAKTNFYTNNSGLYDIMLVKTDYFGTIIWRKVYKIVVPTGTKSVNSEPRKIIPMPNGDFVVVGFTNAYGINQRDILVFRVNAVGTLIWSTTYGSSGLYEEGNSISHQSPNLIVTGSLRNVSPAGSPNAFIMKIPETGGAPLWNRIWDNSNPTDVGYDIINSNIGATSGYAVTGHTSRISVLNDAFLWRVNSAGLLPGTTCNDSIATPYRTNTHKLDSFALVRTQLIDITRAVTQAVPQKFDTTLCISTGAAPYENIEDESKIENKSIDKFALNQNSPNPFNPTTSIKFDMPASGFVSIKVFDVSGRLVSTLVNEFKTSGRHSAVFNGADLSSGVYYYKIQTDGFTDIKKMMLIK